LDVEQSSPASKPADLVALRGLLTSLFAALKNAVGVEDSHTFRLDTIDCADEALTSYNDVAAFTLRKMQALHYVATPGVRTSNNVVMILASDLNLSLGELANHVLTTGREDVFREIIDGRLAINRVSKAVGSLNRSEIIELI